ncbi:CAP domain-containing protein [Mangrovihabitans endophyticus]|uniref:CAP domain-containing protein n=1 Tax=Mangrovihabitans endophyticus TaxID=1751298 RepID=UPI001667C427|nr:CAP domain-containing protein [Mangrovihabitans endophyticus]
MALGLTVLGLLTALGAGATMLPASLTGPGSPAEDSASVIDELAPGAGGGVPGAGLPHDGTAPSGAPTTAGAAPSPATPAASSPAPSPSKSTSAKAKRSRSASAKPTRTVAAKSAPSPADGSAGKGLAAQETEVIRLVNEERDQAGCGAVTLDTRLRTAIRLHVEELGSHGDLYISHVSDDGRTFVDRAKEQGYDDPGGENVARGQRNAADVMTSWMNSEGHRANILNCDFTAIGAGVAKGVDGTLVWGQLFGRS